MFKNNKSIFFSIMILVFLLASSGLMAAEYDFEGETVKFGFTTPDIFQEDSYIQDRVNELEDKFNVDIQFVNMPTPNPFDDQFIPTVMAGDPIADVILYPKAYVTEVWYPEGILQPLDDILDDEYFESLPYMHGENRDLLEIDGSYKMFSALGGLTPEPNLFGNIFFLAWNKDLFEREGLPDMYEVYEEGNWTYDKMMEITEEVTGDTTGDGEIDQWGITNEMEWFFEPYAVSWFLTNEARIAEKIDGEVVYTFDGEPAVEAFSFLQDLYDYRLRTIWDIGGFEEFMAGNIAFAHISLTGDSIYGSGSSTLSTLNEQMDDDYGIIPLPRGPHAEKHSVYSEPHVFVMPITVEQSEAKVELTNALFGLTDEYREMDGLLDEVIEERIMMDLRDRKSVDMFREFVDLINYRNEYEDILEQDHTHVELREISEEGKSVSAALDSISSYHQEIYNELFN